MSANSSNRLEDYDQAYGAHDFGQLCDSGGGAGSLTGDDNSGRLSWATDPAAVDALFQLQQSEFSNPLSLAHDPVLQKQGVGYCDWTGVTVLSDLPVGFPDSSGLSLDGVLPLAGGGVIPPPAANFVLPAASFINGEDPFMAAPSTAEAVGEEMDAEILLKKLRDEGHGYAAISEMMRAKLGIVVTANALVKRYHKMPNTCEGLLAKAISNSMPRIMEQIYAELAHIDDGTLSEEEKQTVSRMMEELPQILPTCARGSLARKRKSKQPSALL